MMTKQVHVEHWRAPIAVQSRRLSLIEAVANVAVGLGVAYGTQVVVFPLFGFNATTGQHVAITAIFTAVSLVRSYAIRRIFCRIRSA